MNKIWEHFYKRVVLCKRGGGSAPSAPAPQQINTAETTQDAIDAQVNSLPQIYDAQQQWGQKFSQQQLDQYNKFAPEYAKTGLDLSTQYGDQFAQQVKSEQDILDPSRSAGSDAITEFLEAGPEGLSQDEEDDITRTSRNATASRGLGESGFGALDETVNLFNARQNLNSRYLNVGLAAAGRLPAAGGQTVQGNPAAYGQGQLVQNVTPSQIFGAQTANMQSANSMNASIFDTQMSNQSSGIGGQILGGLMGGMTSAMSGGLTSALPGFGAGGMFGG